MALPTSLPGRELRPGLRSPGGTPAPTSSAFNRVPALSSLPGLWLASFLVSCLASTLFCVLSQFMDSGPQAAWRVVTHPLARVPARVVMLCSPCLEILHHFGEGLALSFCTEPLPPVMQHALSSAGTSLPLQDSRGPRTQLAGPSIWNAPLRCLLPTQVSPSLGASPDHSINRPLLTLPLLAPPPRCLSLCHWDLLSSFSFFVWREAP